MLEELSAAYATPPRPYHNYAHVGEVLRHFEAASEGPGWTQPREVMLAVLFHDAVYEAGRKDNERRSADLAVAAIEKWSLSADPGRVRHLIELTARHGSLTPSDVDAEAAIFLDCDMAILGADPAAFDAYNTGILQEFAGAGPAWVVRMYRRRFLRGLLKMDRIYLSDWGHARWDAAARENLRRVG